MIKNVIIIWGVIMKKILKQTGKALCYFLLFIGAQAIVTYIFGAIYLMKNKMALVQINETLNMDGMELFLNDYSKYILENILITLIVSELITLIFLWAFFAIRKKKLSEEAMIKKLDKQKIIPIGLLGAILSLIVLILIDLLPIPESILTQYDVNTNVLSSDSLILSIIVAVICAPVVEEVIFRGLILSRLKQAMNPIIALILSSLVFAITHGQILWMSYTFLLGIVCGIVALRTGSIVASIILHMFFNLFGIFASNISNPKRIGHCYSRINCITT